MSVGTPSFASLFSGCGGLDLGFVQAGFRSNLAVDISPTVLRVHELNMGAPVRVADLSLPENVLIFGNECQALIAGSPCQGFSTIGKRRLDDPRNELLLVTGRIAEQLRPKLVVAENVPAVTSGKHKEYWDRLHALLRSAGYQTTELKCDSSTMGVPQKRTRMFLVAWNTGKDVRFSLPRIIGGNLGDALKGASLQANHDPEIMDEGSDGFMVAQRIQQGQKLSNVRSGSRSVHTWNIPDVFGRTNKTERHILEEMIQLRRRYRVRDFGDADPLPSRFLYRRYGRDAIAKLHAKGFLRKIGKCHDLVGTFNGKYRRLRLEQPAPTVDTRFGDPACFLHPTENRGFSAREAARIQGFPDSFLFEGSRAEQFRMIGNAVPPPMAEALASHLREAIGF